MRRPPWHLLAWIASMAVLATPSTGRATTTCSATMGALAFGSIADPSTGSITGSTITVRCDTTSLSVLGRIKVRMCLGIGNYAVPRTMSDAAGTHQLGFQIYTDALRTAPWGLRGAMPGPLLLDMEYDVTLLTGGASQSIAVYASTPTQTNAWAGAYTVTYSGIATALDYRYEEPVLFFPTQYPASCTSGGVNGGTGTFGFNVTASVPRSCDFSTTPNLDFGSHPGPIAGTYDSSTTLSLQCRGGTPWTLSLDTGMSPDGDQRRMRLDTTDAYVRYDLYSDAARSAPLGPGTTLSGSGSGTADTRTVYGRVPTGQNVPAGIYSDKIIATITY